MNKRSRWPGLLLMVGLLCMLAGAIDPLEGSLIILPGGGMIALAAFLGRSRRLKLLAVSLSSLAMGVLALWVISAFGGIRLPGEHAGHSIWWGLFFLPYPIGWMVEIVGAILMLMDAFRSREELIQPAR